MMCGVPLTEQTGARLMGLLPCRVHELLDEKHPHAFQQISLIDKHQIPPFMRRQPSLIIFGSPMGAPSSRARKARRSSLPDRVFGISSRKTTSLNETSWERPALTKTLMS